MILTNDLTVHLEQVSASDLDVARAAWVSNFGEDAREKDGERVGGLVKFLYKNKHMSPFEHGRFTFFIDCPIFVAREFMRHRTFSFNEASGRYKVLNNKFYVPAMHRPLIQKGKVGAYTFEPGTPEQYEVVIRNFHKAYEVCWGGYEEMLEAGIAKEVARIILPVGLYTQFYATVDPRNLMHFLSLRTDPTALEEIRLVAEAMEFFLASQMPFTYAAYKESYE